VCIVIQLVYFFIEHTLRPHNLKKRTRVDNDKIILFTNSFACRLSNNFDRTKNDAVDECYDILESKMVNTKNKFQAINCYNTPDASPPECRGDGDIT